MAKDLRLLLRMLPHLQTLEIERGEQILFITLEQANNSSIVMFRILITHSRI